MQQRDAILEIREAALAGKFDILLVYMFDRIGRRDDETPFVVEWLTRNGIAVWSVCEGEQRFDNHVDKLTNYIGLLAGCWRECKNLRAGPDTYPPVDRRWLFYRRAMSIWV